MNVHDIARIEKSLSVSLPAELVGAYKATVGENFPDEVSFLQNSDSIIENTLSYRRGVADLPKWPTNYIYLGDEDDACPYVFDTETGYVLKLDKGDALKEPICKFGNIDLFINQFKPPQSEQAPKGSLAVLQWLLYHPILFVGLIFFVILPLLGMSVSWIINAIF